MKKIIYFGLFGFYLFLSSPTTAQTAIAVTNDSGSTFYTTLDLAITNASSGDYIYLPGGNFTISVPINKQLQIFGVGHNPDSCAVTGITQVTGDFTIKSGSDHGSIVGLKISGGISFSINTQELDLNYYSIDRCNISGAIRLSAKSSNILVSECVLKGDLYGSSTKGFQMSKCIIEGRYIYSFYSNAYFLNNIFISNLTTLYCVNGCYFRNNVFISSQVYGEYGCTSDNNLFQNNLFNGSFSISPTTNSLRNNITGPVTTLFKNQSGTVFDYKQDYHILDTSPAHNAGTDGTDLGIYGTGSPWKEGSVPSNPHIQSKTFSTVNGNLNVKIKVAAQDH